MNSEENTSRSDRIHICNTKHKIYQDLTEGDSAPFKTMKDLFLTAASLGVIRGNRKPLEKKVPGGIFAWSVFTAQEDVPFLNALILALGEPMELLLDQRKVLDILEEYANGGIGELANDLLSTTNPSLVLANKVLNDPSMATSMPQDPA